MRNRLNFIIQKALLCLIVLVVFALKNAGAQSLNSISPNPVCAGSSVSIAYSGATIGDTMLVWLSDNNGVFSAIENSRQIISSINGNISLFIPQNQIGGNGYLIRIASVLNSNNSDTSLAFTINELPQFSVNQIGPNVFCSGGLPTSITVTPTSGFSFEWFRNGLLVSPPNNSATLVPSLTGNYQVRVSQNSCSKWSGLFPITVHPRPMVNFSFTPDSACSGTPIQFNSTASGGAAPYLYSWNFNAGSSPPAGAPANSSQVNPIVAFSPSSGNGLVQYITQLMITDTNGCSQAVQKTIRVKQRVNPDLLTDGLPSWDAINQVFKNCLATVSNPNFTLELFNNSVSGVTQWSINWGDNSPIFNVSSASFNLGTSVTHTYTSMGLFTITISGTNGQGCTTSRQYQFFNGNSPAITVPNPPNLQGSCAPATFTFQIQGVNQNAPGTTYTFKANDGSPDRIFNQSNVPDTIVHSFFKSSCNSINPFFNGQYNFPNSYIVVVVASNACAVQPAPVSGITINERPQALFTPSDTEICENETILFTNLSVSRSVVNIPNTTSFRCDSNITFRWRVFPSTLILGSDYEFVDNTSQFSRNPRIRFITPGLRTVELTATGILSCPPTVVSRTICVQSPVRPLFTISSSNNCLPTVVQLNNQSQNINCGINRYRWTVLSGTTLLNSSPANSNNYQFVNSTDTSFNAQIRILRAGNYGFRLSITNKCGSRDTVIFITIKDKPQLTISPSVDYCGTTSINFNSPNHTLSVNNQLGAQSPVYNWSLFGTPTGVLTGSNSATPSFQLPGSLSQPVPYRILVRVSNECGFDTVSQLVTIKPIPQLNIRSRIRTICDSTIYRDTLGVKHGLQAALYSWTVSPSSSLILGATAQSTPSSLNLINQTLTNNGTTRGHVDYIYRASVDGCDSEPDTVRVFVDPLPSPAIAGADQVLCAQGSVLLGATVPTVGTGAWSQLGSQPNVATIDAPTSPSTNVTGLITGTYTFIWTVSNSVCPASTDQVQIQVLPPIGNNTIAANQVICSGTIPNGLTGSAPSGGNGSYQYQWISSTTSATTAYSPITGATGSFHNPSALTTTTWYRRIVRSGPCSDTSLPVQITVQPPLANNQIIAPAAVCLGLIPAAITGATPTGGNGSVYQYQWESAPGLSGGTWTLVVGANAASYQPPALTATTRFRRLVTSGTCTLANVSNEVTVVIHPLPVVNVGPDVTLCLNTTPVTLSGTPGGGVWSGSALVNSSTGLFTPSAVTPPTLVYYTFTNNNNCTSKDSLLIQVIDLPVVNAGTGGIYCQNAGPQTLTGFSPAGGTWTGPGVSPQGVFNPIALAPGTYTLTYSFSGGGNNCSNTDTILVRVNPRPSPVIAALSPQCPHASVNLNLTLASGFSTPQFTWSATNNQGLTNAIFSSNSAQQPTLQLPEWQGASVATYQLKVVVQNEFSCLDSATVSLSLNPRPDLLAQLPPLNCGPGQSQVVNTTLGNPSHAWSISPASATVVAATSATPTIRYPVNLTGSAITYTLQGIATNTQGCKDTLLLTNILHPKPEARILLSDTAVCTPVNITATNQSLPSTGLTLNWQLPGSATSTQNAVTFNLTNAGTAPQDFSVVLQVESTHGCRDTADASVRVYPNPKADFSATLTSGCAPFQIGGNNLTPVAYPQANSAYLWQIVSTSGAILQSLSGFNPPNYTLLNANDTVQVRLIVTNAQGCKPDTLVRTFRTIPNPVPNFTVTPSAGCSPQTFNIQNTSSVGVTSNWSFGWQYRRTSPQAGASDTVTLVNTSFSTDSTYRIKLVVTAGSGCRDSLEQNVTVFARPKANFAFLQPAYCAGAQAIAVINSSQAPAGSIYRWRVSNSTAVRISDTTAFQPTFTFPDNQSGTDTSYLVVLEVRSPNGCIDTLRRMVRIQSRPTVNFTVPAGNCGPMTLALAAQVTHSSNSGALPLQYVWSSTPGGSFTTTTSANTSWSVPVNAGPAQLDYTLRVEVTDNLGCKDTMLATKRVFPKPIANFQLASDQSCSPFNLQIQNTSNAQNSEPLASLRFTWNWLNRSDTAAVPAIVLTNTGVVDSIYRIALRIESQHGCVDTLSKPVRVFPDAKASITTQNLTACAPFVIGSSNIQTASFPSTNGTYKWMANGDSIGNTLNFPGFTITQPNDSVLIRFIAFSLNGCKSDTASAIFRTIPNPVPNFTVTPSAGCSPQTFNIQNTSSVGVTSNWSFGWQYRRTNPQAGASDTVTLVNTSFSTDSTYRIKLVVTAGSGCRDSLERNVTVFARPKANFAFLQPAYCAGAQAIAVTNSSQAPAGSIYRWRVSNSTAVRISDTTAFQPTFTFPDNQSGTDTSYLVVLEVRSSNGCIDTIRRIVRIQSRPTVNFTVPAGNCGPMTLALAAQVTHSSNSGALPLQYAWSSTPGGSFTTTTSATTSWSVPVNAGPAQLDYTLRVEVTDNLGCKDTMVATKRVFPKPIANFQLASDQSCSPFNLQIQNTSNAQNSEPLASLRFTWNWLNRSDTVAVPAIVLTNTGVVDSIYRIALRIESQHGCVDTLSKPVRVFPDAKAALVINSALECAPFAITSTQLQATPFPQANSTYEWRANNLLLGTGITFPGYTIQQPADSALISLRVTSPNGCKADTASAWFRTIPNPEPVFQLADTVNCTPFQLATINQTPNASQMNFVWKFGDGSAPLNAVNVQPTFTNADSVDRTVWVRLIAIAGTGCRDSVERHVVVKPLPRPRFAFLDSSVCYPFDAELTNRSGAIPPTKVDAFRWWVLPSAGLAFSNDTASTQTNLDFPDNQSGSTRAYRVWLQASSDFGCIDSVSANLWVPTRPVAQFATLPDSSCGPATIALQQQSLYGQTAQWSGSAALTFSQPSQWSGSVNAPAHRGVVDSVYFIRLRVTNNEGCVDSISNSLRIFPLPIPRFVAQPDSGCGPLQVTFTDSSVGQLPMQYLWNFGDGNSATLQHPIHSFAASRYQDSLYTASMQVTSARGCVDSTSTTIRVKPGPTAVLAISDTLLCTTPAQPARFILQNLSFGLVDTFYWDFGDGSPVRMLTNADTVQHEYLRDGFYWIRLKAVNVCSESFDSVRIAVLEKPKPSFQLDSVGCGPLTLAPLNTTPNILTTYVWNFGNGQTSTLAQPGPITFLPNPNRTDTVYLVSLTAMNVCDTVTWVDSVLVRPKPTAIFAPDTTIGCSPFRLDIFNYSLGGPNTYYWDFGNGDKDTTYSLSTFRYIYYTSRVDTFPLKMVAVNECGADSMQFDIVVFPNTVFPQLIVSGTEKFGCAPHTVKFYNASIGANIFRWRFNDGSSTLVTNRFPDTVTHTFLQAGTYTVEMEASNGCSDTSTFETIVVYPKPVARFLTSTNTLCVGDTLRMQNQSSGASLYQWSFGDGSTSLLPNPNKVYGQPGNYTIRLIVSQTSPPGVTCTDTFFQPIVIRPLPQPVINLNLSQVNCQPYPLVAQVSGAHVWFANWDFGDTVSTAQDTASGLNVRYLYTQPGTFIVKVKAFSSFGCIDSASAPVQVTPSPKAAFLSSNTDSCGPFLVRFTNQTTHLGGGFLTYRWLVDGVQRANSLHFSWLFDPPVNQSNPKVYRVQLIATNGFGCSDTSTQLIRVFPDAKAAFSLAQTVGCAPLTLNIQNISLAASGYRWFLDGQLIDTVAIPAYMISTPNDTFRLQLVALSAFGCKADTAEASIITLPRPVAAFAALPDSGCAPLNVQFQQQSQQAIEYRWNLGNGALSSLVAPSATYLAAIQRDTVYTIRLIVKNSFGCFDTTERAVKVHPDPIASLLIQPTQGCAPLSVQFTQNGWQNATSFIRFGNGSDTLIQGSWSSFTHLYPAFAPRRDTLYPITVVATSPFGCRDTASYQVRVFPDPEPDFSWTPQSPCEGDSVFFTNNSWGGGTYVWDFGNGQFSALPQPVHLFTTSPQRDTSFVVTLTQTTNNGCVKAISKTVNLKAKPKAAFIMSDSIGCNGTLEVRFTNRSLHATRYLWLFGDGSQPSTQASPTHLYPQPGVYIVTLLAFSANGCSDTAFASVSITNRARALFRIDVSQGCEQITVNFNNLSLNAQSFLWSFGDGITTTDRNPSHTYDFVNSPYTVRLIAYGLYGCNDTLERPNSIVVFQPPVADFHVEAFDSVKVQPDRTFKFINRSVFPPLTYRWDFGDGSSPSSEENPTHTYSDTGRYQVQLIVGNANGCLDTMVRQVRIDTAECYLWIPTAFMPDQKQLRDEVQYFRAVGKNLQSFRITVFNKWGEVVFETDKLEDGKPIEFWNGINQRTGEECKQDVYVWRVEATFVNGDVWPGQEEEFGILKKTGTVTLIR